MGGAGIGRKQGEKGAKLDKDWETVPESMVQKHMGVVSGYLKG